MGRRNTIQCALVLDVVNEMKCHVTADEVYEALLQQHPTISRGTVYRNLQRLCEMGKIRKREIPNGADRFDHLCSDHYHVRCVKCGHVSDVDMTYIANLQNTIKDTHGFVFSEHDIVFKGTCPDCRSNSQA